MKRFASSVLVLISLLFLLILVYIAVHAISLGENTITTKKLLISCQPDEISYKSWDPYCIWLISSHRVTGVEYSFWIAKKIAPNYGYNISYPHNGDINDEKALQAIIVWTSEGIDIETHSKDKLFIQKNNFIGGR